MANLENISLKILETCLLLLERGKRNSSNLPKLPAWTTCKNSVFCVRHRPKCRKGCSSAQLVRDKTSWSTLLWPSSYIYSKSSQRKHVWDHWDLLRLRRLRLKDLVVLHSDGCNGCLRSMAPWLLGQFAGKIIELLEDSLAAHVWLPHGTMWGPQDS